MSVVRTSRIFLVVILAVTSIPIYSVMRRSNAHVDVRSIEHTQVVRVGVEIDSNWGEGSVGSVGTTSPEKVQSILNVLRSRTDARRHKCAPMGSINIELA